MNEKTIIKGELKNSKLFCMLLPILGLIGTILYDFSVSNLGGELSLSYGFSFGNGANFVLYPMILVLAVIGFIIYSRWSKVSLTVTDKRVYGVNSVAKRVDLPLDSISAVGTSAFSGLAVTTASGAIRFVMLKNRDELHDAISNLLVGRQEKTVASTTVKQEISQSNAEEIKKFKELLDSGVISQEEFDAKKKDLLGL